MGFADTLLNAYYAVEDRWFDLLDWMDGKGVPVYKLVDPIEKHGIPSLPVFAAVLMLVVYFTAGIVGGLGGAGPQPVPISISVVSNTGASIPNAKVQLFDQEDNPVDGGYTDADGLLSLNVLPGTYTVKVAEVENCEDAEEEITVQGQQAQPYTITLNCQGIKPAASQVTFCVQDSEGKVFLPNVTYTEYSGYGYKVKTGECTGTSCTLTAVKDHTYSFRAVYGADEYYLKGVTWEDLTRAGQSTECLKLEKQERTPKEMGSVCVTVYSPDQKVVPYAVSVELYDAHSGSTKKVARTRDGTACMDYPLYSPFRIGVLSEDYLYYKSNLTYELNESVRSLSLNVTLEDAESTTFITKKAGEVAALPNVHYKVFDRNRVKFLEAETNANGRSTVGLKKGEEYTAMFYKYLYEVKEANVTVGGENVVELTRLNPNDYGSLAVDVFYEDGSYADGVDLKLYRLENNKPEEWAAPDQTTDSYGHAVFPWVEPGDYCVEAVKGKSMTPCSSETTVTVEAGKQAYLQVRMESEKVNIMVVVSSPSGERVKGAKVSVESKWLDRTEQETNAAGVAFFEGLIRKDTVVDVDAKYVDPETKETYYTMLPGVVMDTDKTLNITLTRPNASVNVMGLEFSSGETQDKLTAGKWYYLVVSYGLLQEYKNTSIELKLPDEMISVQAEQEYEYDAGDNKIRIIDSQPQESAVKQVRIPVYVRHWKGSESKELVIRYHGSWQKPQVTVRDPGEGEKEFKITAYNGEGTYLPGEGLTVIWSLFDSENRPLSSPVQLSPGEDATAVVTVVNEKPETYNKDISLSVSGEGNLLRVNEVKYKCEGETTAHAVTRTGNKYIISRYCPGATESDYGLRPFKSLTITMKLHALTPAQKGAYHQYIHVKPGSGDSQKQVIITTDKTQCKPEEEYTEEDWEKGTMVCNQNAGIMEYATITVDGKDYYWKKIPDVGFMKPFTLTYLVKQMPGADTELEGKTITIKEESSSGTHFDVDTATGNDNVVAYTENKQKWNYHIIYSGDVVAVAVGKGYYNGKGKLSITLGNGENIIDRVYLNVEKAPRPETCSEDQKVCLEVYRLKGSGEYKTSGTGSPVEKEYKNTLSNPVVIVTDSPSKTSFSLNKLEISGSCAGKATVRIGTVKKWYSYSYQDKKVEWKDDTLEITKEARITLEFREQKTLTAEDGVLSFNDVGKVTPDEKGKIALMIKCDGTLKLAQEKNGGQTIVLNKPKSLTKTTKEGHYYSLSCPGKQVMLAFSCYDSLPEYLESMGCEVEKTYKCTERTKYTADHITYSEAPAVEMEWEAKEPANIRLEEGRTGKYQIVLSYYGTDTLSDTVRISTQEGYFRLVKGAGDSAKAVLHSGEERGAKLEYTLGTDYSNGQGTYRQATVKDYKGIAYGDSLVINLGLYGFIPETDTLNVSVGGRSLDVTVPISPWTKDYKCSEEVPLCWSTSMTDEDGNICNPSQPGACALKIGEEATLDISLIKKGDVPLVPDKISLEYSGEENAVSRSAASCSVSPEATACEPAQGNSPEDVVLEIAGDKFQQASISIPVKATFYGKMGYELKVTTGSEEHSLASMSAPVGGFMKVQSPEEIDIDEFTPEVTVPLKDLNTNTILTSKYIKRIEITQAGETVCTLDKSVEGGITDSENGIKLDLGLCLLSNERRDFPWKELLDQDQNAQMIIESDERIAGQPYFDKPVTVPMKIKACYPDRLDSEDNTLIISQKNDVSIILNNRCDGVSVSGASVLKAEVSSDEGTADCLASGAWRCSAENVKVESDESQITFSASITLYAPFPSTNTNIDVKGEFTAEKNGITKKVPIEYKATVQEEAAAPAGGVEVISADFSKTLKKGETFDPDAFATLAQILTGAKTPNQAFRSVYYKLNKDEMYIAVNTLGLDDEVFTDFWPEIGYGTVKTTNYQTAEGTTKKLRYYETGKLSDMNPKEKLENFLAFIPADASSIAEKRPSVYQTRVVITTGKSIEEEVHKLMNALWGVGEKEGYSVSYSRSVLGDEEYTHNLIIETCFDETQQACQDLWENVPELENRFPAAGLAYLDKNNYLHIVGPTLDSVKEFIDNIIRFSKGNEVLEIRDGKWITSRTDYEVLNLLGTSLSEDEKAQIRNIIHEKTGKDVVEEGEEVGEDQVRVVYRSSPEEVSWPYIIIGRPSDFTPEQVGEYSEILNFKAAVSEKAGWTLPEDTAVYWETANHVYLSIPQGKESKISSLLSERLGSGQDNSITTVADNDLGKVIMEFKEGDYKTLAKVLYYTTTSEHKTIALYLSSAPGIQACEIPSTPTTMKGIQQNTLDTINGMTAGRKLIKISNKNLVVKDAPSPAGENDKRVFYGKCAAFCGNMRYTGEDKKHIALDCYVPLNVFADEIDIIPLQAEGTEITVGVETKTIWSSTETLKFSPKGFVPYIHLKIKGGSFPSDGTTISLPIGLGNLRVNVIMGSEDSGGTITYTISPWGSYYTVTGAEKKGPSESGSGENCGYKVICHGLSNWKLCDTEKVTLKCPDEALCVNKANGYCSWTCLAQNSKGSCLYCEGGLATKEGWCVTKGPNADYEHYQEYVSAQSESED